MPSRSTSLMQLLAERGSVGKCLADSITDRVRPAAARIMAQAAALFPDFTPHTIEHSDSVAAHLAWIIPERVKTHLNEWELYFLLSACYLHDIGMVETIPASPEGEVFEAFVSDFLLKWPQASRRDALREFVRRDHHRRSERYISTHGNFVGLGQDNPQYWEIVGRLAAGHRLEDLRNRQRYDLAFVSAGIPIHLDILAAYLRLADECDITADRTPLIAFEAVQPRGLALRHWESHLSISGVGPRANRIVVSGTCRDHDVFLFLMDLEQKLQSTLDEMREVITENYVLADEEILRNPIPFDRVEFRIESKGFKAWQIRFQLDVTSMTEILTSPLFYSDRTAAIRELVQNAVDACHHRQQTRPSGIPYSPEIRVQLSVNPGGRSILVADNGIGLSEEIAQRRLSYVGRSYYRSSEFTDLGLPMEPLGRFGIGLLSTFMLGTGIRIDSKRGGSEALRIEITDPGSYFKVTESERQDIGTDVVVALKPNLELDLFEAAQRYFVCLDIPITIGVDDYQIRILPNPMLAINSEVVWRERGLATEWPRWFAHEVEESNENFNARMVLYTPDPSDFMLQSFFIHFPPSVKVCNQGFLIEESDFGLRYGKEHSGSQGSQDKSLAGMPVVGLVNFRQHPESLAFTRDRLIESPWTTNREREVRRLYLKGVGQAVESVSNRLDLPALMKRTWLHPVFSIAIWSGYGAAPPGLQKGKLNLLYSVDGEVQATLSALYGDHYPIAWKVGDDAVLATLQSVIQAHPQAKIVCHRADPAYPQFSATERKDQSEEWYAVLDNPREYALIQGYLTEQAFEGSVDYLDGWDMFQRAGATFAQNLLSTHLGGIPLCDYDGGGDDWLIAIIDAAIFADVATPIGDYSWFGSSFHPLVVANRTHPVIVWIENNEQQLTSDEFLLFRTAFLDLARWAVKAHRRTDMSRRDLPVLPGIPESLVATTRAFARRSGFPGLKARKAGDLVLFSENFGRWPIIEGVKGGVVLEGRLPSHTAWPVTTWGDLQGVRIQADRQMRWWTQVDERGLPEL